MSTIKLFTAKECSLNAKENSWCTYYRKQCLITCEYAIKREIKAYKEDNIISDFDDEYDPDSDDSHECCEECGCYHGHNPWCGYYSE